MSEPAGLNELPCSVAETLQPYRINNIGSGFYYIPNYIDSNLETQVLDGTYSLPESRWTVLSHRRLLSLPGPLTGTKRDSLLHAALPSFLTANITDKFKELQIFENSPHKAPNHCLVNEYLPGQGIMPHEDGPAYYPITATVSLASHTVLEIYEKTATGEREQKPKWRILQEPRSLLVTTGDIYSTTLHGIAELQQDEDLNEASIANWDTLGNRELYMSGTVERQKRISLTFRDVLKVIRIGGSNKLLGRR